VKIKTVALLRVLVAGVLGFATLEIIGHIRSPGFRDGLALPGALISTLGSMVGLYDVPSGPWAVACMFGNFLFYAGVWWALLSFAVRRLTIGSSDRGGRFGGEGGSR
jgi:hypothetical protein